MIVVYGLLGEYVLNRTGAGHYWRRMTEVEQATQLGYCGA